MTAKDLIANLQLSDAQLDPAECFLYMAAHAHEARLTNGARLCDVSDFTAWLLELAAELRPGSSVLAAAVNDSRNRNRAPHAIDPTCPRCGHIHQGEAECGEQMGGGRICRCELEVPA